jgi:hypothetical protein
MNKNKIGTILSKYKIYLFSDKEALFRVCLELRKNGKFNPD